MKQSILLTLCGILLSFSAMANDTIRIYSNGCDDYQTFIGSHGGQLTMSANSDQWSHFVRWNDGNTDNPRTITTNGNADYTAYFETYKYSVQVKSDDAARGGGYISKVVKGDTLEYNDSVGSFDAGSEVFLAYQANYGYHFDKWSDGNTSQQRSFILAKDTTFTATFAKNVYTITLNNAEHGSISGDTSAEYLDEVTLTANPDYGYHFAQWSDGVTDNPHTIVLTQDTSFTAEFAKNTYTITTESSNPQWGTTAGDNSALYLDEVEISATANYGYHFDQWIDTIYLEVDFSTVITASQAYNIASQLEDNQVSSETYTIHGYVRNLYENYRNSYYIADTPDGEANFIIFKADKPANIGDHVLVHGQLKNYKGTTPETNSGALLHIISPEGTYVSVATTNTNPRTIKVERDMRIWAEFAKNQYRINGNTNGHGTVGGTGSFDYLSECTIQANPDYGYHFVQWSDGNKENPRIFQMTQDTTFTAEFAKSTYTITTESSNPQWGTTAGDNSALYLDEVEISATANYGYHFVKWDIEKYQEHIEYGSLLMVKFSVPETWSNPYAWIWETGGDGHWETLSYEKGMYVYRTEQNNMNIIVVPNGPGWAYGQTNDLAITESCCYTITGEYEDSNNSWTSSNYATTKNFDCFSAEEQAKIDQVDTIIYIDTTITYATANPLSLLVTQNQKAIAYFAKNVYSITKNAEHGSISGGTSAEYLDEVTLTANPDYGYHFTQWSDGNTDNPRTITLTSDTTFTAQFVKNSYTISTNSANPEWGTTAGDTAVLYLDEVEISATANYGYRFVRWDDNNTSNPRTVSVTEDKTFTATFAKNVYSITKNAEHGTISGNSSAEYLDQVTLSISSDYGYHFTHWSDGNTNNPRTFVLTQDTTFTAEFAIDKNGTCGNNNLLQWTFADDGTLTISGSGELTENYTFGIEAPAQMQKLVIGNEVTSIGDSAFYGMSTINHLIIGGSVATIGNYAFAECRNFDDITCLANVVPVINETTFANVGNKQYIYLFVPAERERAYHRDAYWCEFDIQVQQAEETTVTTNDVQVEPQDNAATLTWPTNGNAASYTIEITKDGVLFCTLTFNANGQLTGIAFAPSRDGQAHAPQAIMTANGLQFTVTGLNSNTQYGYSLIVKDANNQPIATYSGEFTTTGEIATGIDNIQGNEVQSKKFVRDGQIFILRGDKIYTLQGQEVK